MILKINHLPCFRPPFLIDTLETGLKEEPLFAKVETEKSFYSRIYEFQKKEPEATINEEESWKIWRKWALKCNDRLKFSSKEFAKMVVESGAHDHNSFNRQQLSHVFENTYHAALACRIGGALTLCTSHIERMSAMECDLETVVHQAVSDAKALCVEKYVVSPLVEVQFSDKKGAIKEKQFVRDKLVWPIVAVESQIRFVVVEALKNAAKSLIKKYGILGIEDRAPPVSVLVEQCGNKTMITIADEGIGIDPAEVEKCMSCFYTSYNVPLKADATVSDAFGKFSYSLSHEKVIFS